MAENEKITGQIVLRDSSHEIPGVPDDDRKLMMLVGVIAVPKGLNLKGECKYTICSKPQASGLEGLFQLVDPDMGALSPEFDEINLVLFPESEEDISDETIGQAAGGILTSHRRWRV